MKAGLEQELKDLDAEIKAVKKEAKSEPKKRAPKAKPAADAAAVLDFLCECLSGDFDIEHSTFQLETEDRKRLESGTHP